MLASLVAILAGLVLLTGLLGVIPAFGEHLERFAKFIGSFQGLIGIIAIIVGILELWSGTGLILIIAGIMLAAGILQTLPGIGDEMRRLAKFLGSFQTIIGIVTLFVGVFGLL